MLKSRHEDTELLLDYMFIKFMVEVELQMELYDWIIINKIKNATLVHK